MSSTLPPVRCFSCGHVIGDCFDAFHEVPVAQDPVSISDGSEESEMFSPERGDALNRLGITRICCRSVLLGHIKSFE